MEETPRVPDVRRRDEGVCMTDHLPRHRSDLTLSQSEIGNIVTSPCSCFSPDKHGSDRCCVLLHLGERFYLDNRITELATRAVSCTKRRRSRREIWA
ncbi:hypothetical protein RRG08_046842 [Elysia crispata]|uniref:Uncharacterized protein n=1 Tax=Elysia crispata TaxID=231223 RepID=A0AAE0ZPK4_9GAST|nr:hypothetical protein RRG08_046842 [Elysia crispata]